MAAWLNRRYKILLVALSLCFTGHLFGQNTHHIVGVRTHAGAILAHSKELPNVRQTRPWGLEVEKTWQLTRKESWQYCFCYPNAGMAFFYLNFDNPQLLGEGFALETFIEPVWNVSRNFYTTFRFGIGPVYLNQVYDEETNPDNTFYSSPISFLVLLRFNLNYRLNNHLSLSLSPAFNHISNGGISNPNKGINFPTLGVGIEYALSQQNYPNWDKDKSVKLIDYNFRTDIIGIATAKTAVKGHAKYLVSGLSVHGAYPVGRINAVNAALEFIVDDADAKKIQRDTTISNTTSANYLAVMGGHEWIFGRFNFGIQLGYYLYSPYKRPDPVFHRWNLTYYITENIFLGINLKAHYHVADFMDMRLGYSLFSEKE